MSPIGFHKLVSERFLVRHFKSTPIPQPLINTLIDSAHWTLTDCNLQPVHYFQITSPEAKASIQKACLGFSQIGQAPIVIVITASRLAPQENFQEVCEEDLATGCADLDDIEARIEYIKFNFDTSPLGIGWLAKWIFSPLLRLFTPIPRFASVYKREWLLKQAMFSSSTLVLAAHSQGLSTFCCHNFDERRIKRACNIPKNHVVAFVVAIGYPDVQVRYDTRIDMDTIFHQE